VANPGLCEGNEVRIGCDDAESIGFGPLEYDDFVGPLKAELPDMCKAGEKARDFRREGTSPQIGLTRYLSSVLLDSPASSVPD